MSMVSIQKPEKVFQYFEKICSIPHGSRNVEKISNYLYHLQKSMVLNIVRMKNIM